MRTTEERLASAEMKLESLRRKADRWLKLAGDNRNDTGGVVEYARNEVMKECAETVLSIAGK